MVLDGNNENNNDTMPKFSHPYRLVHHGLRFIAVFVDNIGSTNIPKGSSTGFGREALLLVHKKLNQITSSRRGMKRSNSVVGLDLGP